MTPAMRSVSLAFGWLAIAGLCKFLSLAPLYAFSPVLIAVYYTAKSINHATDPDPERLRVSITPDEASLAQERLAWIDATVIEFARRAGIGRLRKTAFANRGIYYQPFFNQFSISRAVCARLSEHALMIILAHEVGHASRRWMCFRGADLNEEYLADKFALNMTGAKREDWLHAMSTALNAEGISTEQPDIAARARALERI